jgi:hypothetical protein
MNWVAPGCLNPDGSPQTEQQKFGLMYSLDRRGIFVSTRLTVLMKEVRTGARNIRMRIFCTKVAPCIRGQCRAGLQIVQPRRCSAEATFTHSAHDIKLGGDAAKRFGHGNPRYVELTTMFRTVI